MSETSIPTSAEEVETETYNKDEVTAKVTRAVITTIVSFGAVAIVRVGMNRLFDHLESECPLKETDES